MHTVQRVCLMVFAVTVPVRAEFGNLPAIAEAGGQLASGKKYDEVLANLLRSIETNPRDANSVYVQNLINDLQTSIKDRKNNLWDV